jgi:hypothetical protein
MTKRSISVSLQERNKGLGVQFSLVGLGVNITVAGNKPYSSFFFLMIYKNNFFFLFFFFFADVGISIVAHIVLIDFLYSNKMPPINPSFPECVMVAFLIYQHLTCNHLKLHHHNKTWHFIPPP